jgi:hypothetical protein
VRVQREGAQLQAQGTWSAGEGDDNQRFLADLRALRDTAALEFDELAARAHYPSDVLKEAENGPSLPGLPILTAYVRACDADVLEWEERWRRLGAESLADPGLPVRLAGASPAAVAGARAAVGVAPPDAYDPERIRAALRGSQGRSDRGGRSIASRVAPRRVERDAAGPATVDPVVPESPATWGAGTSWDAGTTAGRGTGWDGFQREADEHWDSAAASSSANGNHYASQGGDGPSGTAVIEPPDTAHADAIRRDPFSADWPQDSELTSTPDSESGWQDRAEAGPAPATQDDWFTPREATDPEQTWSAADTEASSATTDTWFTPRERAEDGLARPRSAEHDVVPPQEHTGSAAAGVTGFWTPATAASAPAEVQRPGPLAKEHANPQASWPAPAETSAGDTPDTADHTTPVLAQAPAAAAVPSRTITGPAVPPGPVVPPSKPRSDRTFMARLLVVMVVAALIGSVLVLLVR